MRLTAFALSLFAAPLAHGQGFNLDLGPGGVPTAGYGAASGQSGAWMRVENQVTSNLIAIDGTASGATLTLSAAPSPESSNHPGTGGDDERLLDDRVRPEPFFVDFAFSGLEPGEYELFVYIVDDGFNPGYEEVRAIGAGPSAAVIGGWGGAFVQGENYERFHKQVLDGTLVVRVNGFLFLDYCIVNGLQLVRLGAADSTVAYCGALDGGIDCPCFNVDAPEAGCENSTGSGGLLEATGTTSVAADDLGFAAHELLPGQAALLFVGTSALNQGDGVFFGDGKRCAGGSVTRLGARVPNAAGDATWGPGLAAPGGWSPGDARHVQVWYRDPSGSPCGNGFNLSNAVAALFEP